MLAPVRRPLAAPIAGAAAAAQGDELTRQYTPVKSAYLVSAFLDRATEVTPPAESTLPKFCHPLTRSAFACALLSEARVCSIVFIGL